MSKNTKEVMKGNNFRTLQINESEEKYIYIQYILNIYRRYTLQDIHRLPIHFKKHTALRLLQRFELSLDEVKHYIRAAKIIKPVEKDGNIGIMQSNLGDSKIKFVFTIREKALWIITVEECK